MRARSADTTSEDKLYVCAVSDVFTRRIVGYSIDSRMKSSLSLGALNNTVMPRGDVDERTLLTDRGSQFRIRKLRFVLDRNEMVGLMGRVGAARVSAVMESFFSLRQKNVMNRRAWATRGRLRLATMTWIERTDYRRR